MKVPIRSHVLRGLSGSQDRLKRLFHKVVHRNRQEDLISQGSFVPVTNIYERSEKLVYEIEVPGLDRKDLDVALNGNVLFVHGERELERGEKKGNWLWKETFHGAFGTSFELPEWVDADSIQAEYRNGLLRIEVKKETWAMPKRIPISSGSMSAFSRAA